MPLWAQLVVISGGIAAVYGAGKAIAKIVAGLWHGARRVQRLLDDWFGEEPRPGLPEGRKGLLARVDAIERRLDGLATREEVAATREEVAALRERIGAVEQQLQPNGGSSFRDAVDRALKDEAPRIEAGGFGFTAELAPGNG